MNFFTDAVLQPTVTALVEIALWTAIVASTGQATLGGFAKESYLAYALWAAFFARTSANWMYEGRMVDEVETGSVNSVLVRPISFYEYYFSQFMGYKLLTATSIVVPITASLFISGPTDLSRLPLAFCLQLYYLILVHTISFTVASFAFFLNRVFAFTIAKNIALGMVTGELFPLDLISEPIRSYVLMLPFANAVYIPVGYLTGRVGIDLVWQGFASITISLLIFGSIARMFWLQGRKVYSGTGA